jgi:hypothetical protein
MSDTTKTTATRLSYLAHYPRDFANEYAIYAGTPAELAQLEEILDRRSERNTCHKVDRKEAIRRGWNRPREAKKTGEFWLGGFAEPEAYAPYADTIQQAIVNAHKATQERIERDEIDQEAREEFLRDAREAAGR